MVVLKRLRSWLQEPGEPILSILSVIPTLLGHAGDVLKRECSQRWTPECVGLHQSLQAHPVKTHMNGGVSTRTSALLINHRKITPRLALSAARIDAAAAALPACLSGFFCTLRQPPGGHLSHPWGPLSPSPWRLQVMRGINATLRLAAASRVLGGNCFHTAFTGESGRRSRKPQQGFMRWDSPSPPPKSASPSSSRWGRGLLWRGNASALLPLVSVRIKVLPPAGL